MRAMAVEIERQIEASGLQPTFLRPGMFASNVLSWWAPQIRAGEEVIRWPYAAVPTAPIDERDIAAVAVRALCHSAEAPVDAVLTGPESLTQSEQLTIIGDAIGRRLHLEEISPDEARRELPPTMPLFIVDMLLAAWGAAAGRPALVTSTVQELTGRPATSFQDWAAAHAAHFQS
jgi:uncharacterized protein YbjT (DUF2867 family)